MLNGKVIDAIELDQIMKFDYDGPKSYHTEIEEELPFESSILTKASEVNQLANLVGQYKFELLYKATINGFKP